MTRTLPIARRAETPLRCGKRHWQWSAMAVIALIVAGGGCGGCGGCGCSSGSQAMRVSPAELEKVKKHRAEKAAKEAKEAEAAKKKADEEKERKAREAKQAARKTAEAKQAAAGAEQPDAEPEAPPRPADLAQWRDEDYLAARDESDPRLLEAAEHLGRAGAGRPEAAVLLVQMLQSCGEEGAQRPRSRTPLRPEPVRALVGALGANNTPEARRALEEILVGRLATDQAQTAREAAIQALGLAPPTEREEILFRALLEGTAGTAPSGGRQRAGDLSALVLDHAPPDTSERIRVRLARHLAGLPAADPAHARLWGLLEEPRLDNLAAQIALYREHRTPPATRARVEELLVAYAGDLARRVTGLAETSPAGSPVRAPYPGSAAAAGWAAAGRHASTRDAVLADPAFLTRAAPQFYGPEFPVFLGERLDRINSLKDHGRLAALAATVPLGTVRAHLLDALRRNLQDGPEGLRAAGLGGPVVCEPGFLVSLKLLTRGMTMPGEGPVRPAPGARPGAASDLTAARRKREQLEADWLRFSLDVLRAARLRLDETCRSGPRAAGAPAAAPAGPPPLPIELHEGARVVGVHQIAWPAEGQETALGVRLDPLTLCYVRIEETARFKRLVNYYRRQTGARRETSTAERLWLESVRDPREGGPTSTLDVLITRAAPDAHFEMLDQDEKITVEVLFIELPDPAARASSDRS